jgi:hypothetical protein
MKIKLKFENMWLWDTTTIRLIPELTLSHLYQRNYLTKKREDIENPEFHINWLGFQFGIQVILK